MANRPRSLWARAAGLGLTAGSGGTQDVDLNELPAVDADVATDSLAVIDATDDSSGKEAIADIIADVAGEGLIATAGVLSIDLDEHGDAVLDPAVDTIPFIDESAAGDPTKLESVADFVAAIGGTAATTGLSNLAGVLTAAIKLAHLVADEKSALFFEDLEVDFGVATAVDEKITDAITAKGKLISVQAVVTEAFTGDASSVIQLSKAATGATAMCSAITVVVGECPNKLGGVFGVIPNADGSEVVASGGDVYAYSAAVNNRSAGKIRFVCMFQKTA